MVVSWILNSISNDIAEAFLYTTSARELWLDLETRFGKSNGHLLYKIQREIASMSQENLSVTIYFTKLKKLWDELGSLSPLPSHSCGTSRELAKRDTSNQLIQSLMGFNEAYDHVPSQILLMDPLSTIGKACSMILREEKQREVHSEFTSFDKEGAMAARFGDTRRQGFNRGSPKKKGFLEKKQLHCEHCKMIEHTRKNCFKLKGDVCLLKGKSVFTQLLVGVKFSSEAGAAIQDASRYGTLIGRLLYLGFTRPHVSHAEQQLSLFVQHPLSTALRCCVALG
ncbi:UNVERIFIED_CONTAM: hypothetical protein Sangu_1007000 [Sesamum angustifolium]|uniref:Retrotransposon gag domain-containing protein n=1 Tax=Sesamum angustifolium TaxID=2727405 RepID=A0AAW2PDG9_9LAMI